MRSDTDHRNLSTEHTEDTDVFFGGCFARNLMWKSVLKNGLWPEMLWIHGAHGGHGIIYEYR